MRESQVRTLHGQQHKPSYLGVACTRLEAHNTGRQNPTRMDCRPNIKGGDTMAQNPNDHTDGQPARSLTDHLTKAHASANSQRVRQALAQLKPAFKY